MLASVLPLGGFNMYEAQPAEAEKETEKIIFIYRTHDYSYYSTYIRLVSSDTSVNTEQDFRLRQDR